MVKSSYLCLLKENFNKLGYFFNKFLENIEKNELDSPIGKWSTEGCGYFPTLPFQMIMLLIMLLLLLEVWFNLLVDCSVYKANRVESWTY